MEERDWLILQVLYEKKNITKTAAALYISQPRLTSRLQEIENRFGIQIVTRDHKGVAFTPEGKCLVDYANKILKNLQDMEERIRTMKKEVKGTLRIGATNYLIKHKLPNVLAQFREKYHDVNFKIITDLSTNLVKQIFNHEIDVAFVRGEHDWLYKKDFLFEENLYIFSAKKLDIENLPVLPRIDYSNNKIFKDMFDEWWNDNFSTPPFVVMEVNSVDAFKEMIRKGIGYAFLPEGLFNDSDGLYKIKMLDKAGQPLVRRAWMFYHADRLKIASVRHFVDFINNTGKHYNWLSK